jgi:hypothetical protein
MTRIASRPATRIAVAICESSEGKFSDADIDYFRNEVHRLCVERTDIAIAS